MASQTFFGTWSENIDYVSGNLWTNHDNALADDGSYSSSLVTQYADSDYLVTNNYAFEIPDGATIDGIEVTVERLSQTANTEVDKSVRLMKSGGVTGSDKADTVTKYPTTYGTATYGGSTDLWGTTWTVAEINRCIVNGDGFGVAFAVDGGSSGKSNQVRVDYVKIKVYYSYDDLAVEGYAGTVAEDSSYGTHVWTNPSNAASRDNSLATTTGTLSTRYLKATNFGFSVPSGSTINGIEVIFAKAYNVSGNQSRVSIVKGGVIGSTDLADTTAEGKVGTWSTSSVGGTSQLWGEIWAYSDINSSNFGVVISLASSHGKSVTFEVDSIKIIVNYSEGSTTEIKNSSVKANIVTTNIEDNYVKANIKNIDIEKTIQAKTRIRLSKSKTVQSKSRINLSKIQTVQSKSRVLVADITKTVQSKSRISISDIEKTIQSKSRIASTSIVKTISVKATIYKGISKTFLVSPVDISSGFSPAIFVWTIPTDSSNNPVHSHIQIDKTSSAFGDLEAEQQSWNDNTNMEYDNGSSWVTYPTTGVTSAYYGNQARLTQSLTNGTKYWRVRGITG